jgi:hypothetical protein
VRTYGCEVTGVDLTPSFCEAAAEMPRWVGLADRVTFMQGDATALDFDAEDLRCRHHHSRGDEHRRELATATARRRLLVDAGFTIIERSGG